MVSEPAVKEQVIMPEGVTPSLERGLLSLKGSQGSVSREFIYPKIDVAIDKTEDGLTAVFISSPLYTLREKKIIRTFRAHIRNMVKGVTEGHEYKLKICSGHFPMNVTVKGQTIEVKNFFGESVPRTYSFSDDVKVAVNGESVVVTGIEKELVAQTAASIEKLTRRVGFDRKVFQDGIYIVEKDGKAI